MWDIATNRRHAAPDLENEPFVIFSLAFAPDGRTLAAGGASLEPNGRRGQVRLYDFAREPFSRRAVLTFDGDAPGVGVPMDKPITCSDVAFTPDGRRVAAVGMQRIRIWDAATGALEDAFERMGSRDSDKLAVSPDGRWLAVTQPFAAGLSIFDIGPP